MRVWNTLAPILSRVATARHVEGVVQRLARGWTWPWNTLSKFSGW